MRLIKTLDDLRDLRALGTLPSSFRGFLDQEFLDAAHEVIFPGDEPTEDFSLEGFGHLVLLEQGDTEADWAKEGLVIDQSVVAPVPEFAERLDIDDFAVYRIAVMFDNDDIVRYQARTIVTTT